MGAVFWLSR